jgi:putative ubiquitin-RnfH superfamily antitoxin RatB of RatAB toxin-antitoxin module
MSDKINIEVVYALPHEQVLLRKFVPAGTTVAQAIQASGILDKYPEIDLANNKLGIFGKLTKADVVLRDKDRIEIYRPLIADPKEVRRKRAEQGKAMTAGGSPQRGGVPTGVPLAGAAEGSLPAPRPPAGRASGGVPFTGGSSGVPPGVTLAGAKNGGEI